MRSTSRRIGACVLAAAVFALALASESRAAGALVDIKPSKKVALRYPFSLSPREPLILSTVDGVMAKVKKLLKPVRSKVNAELPDWFENKWSNYQTKLKNIESVMPADPHHSFGEGFAIHWAVPRKAIVQHEKSLAMLVPRLDRIFGPNVFRCTDWSDTDFVIFSAASHYNSYVDNLAKQKKVTSDNAALMKKTSSAGGSHFMFMNAEGARINVLPHQLAHSFGKMLIQRVGAEEKKLPDWLTAGFGSYCEIIALSKNVARPDFTKAVVRSIAYEIRDEQYELNWLSALKGLVRKNKVKHLQYVIMSDLSGMDATNQYQIRSLVYFLIHGGPGFNRKFLKFISELKSGTDQNRALKIAYRTSPVRLDAAWRQYVLSRMR